MYQRLCAKCHGSDGTGNRAREDQPEIPDFTDATWQARRTDAQLVASILDGKEEMPDFSGRITQERVGDLVVHVRAFAPTAGEPRKQMQGAIVPSQVAPSERSLFKKSIRWLGNFHPPTVHFPIALLTAAAVAELLRMATAKPAFDAASRYCLWFGTVTALAAGLLGWFLARFRLTDASEVMMAHRWLGTVTVIGAGLVLVLGEASRRRDRRRTRIGFRFALLVVAMLVLVTGFFGGAVVFGLDHYRWPR
jgi:uncharacterized membrane protein